MFAVLATSVMLSMPADWDKFDTAMLSVLAVESVYDVMSTSYRLQHPTENVGPGYYFVESNPMLGTHPDSFRLWTTAILSNTIMLFACMMLPPWPRRVLEVLVVGAETGNLISNAYLPGYVAWKVAF